ncbi:MAG: methyltransferase domain-containing protein [Actinomycetota bacterium]|jgi:ubiquinone/menaquinone biosynthesis C-methylase UbiE|nr:methyltransferase domain-containing protein [Actinomycetota bacterium]MCL6092582.1 methyltransferase domain-containing protein [Actinomycetota bacterium]MDA8166874.1 methyltransferase domain-containing protein [Actinomycetota bacterium]
MHDKPIAAGRSSFDFVDTEAVFRALELDQGTVLLDLASGAGNYSLAIAGSEGSGSVIHAFDLWEEGIAQLKQRVAEAGLTNITAAVADVTKTIPMGDGSADVCLIATALHDLVQEQGGEGVLREIARVLKPAGRLVIVEFVKADGPPGPPKHIRLSPEELDALVLPFGFARQRTAPAGDYFYLTVYTRN